MAAANAQSLAITFRRWGPPWSFHAQSAPHPSPVDSDWSAEDWDGELEKEKRKEKQRKEQEMKWRQDEEKKILDPNYYQPGPIYVPSNEEQPPTLVNDLISAQENPRDAKQDRDRQKISSRTSR